MLKNFIMIYKILLTYFTLAFLCNQNSFSQIETIDERKIISTLSSDLEAKGIGLDVKYQRTESLMNEIYNNKILNFANLTGSLIILDKSNIFNTPEDYKLIKEAFVDDGYITVKCKSNTFYEFMVKERIYGNIDEVTSLLDETLTPELVTVIANIYKIKINNNILSKENKGLLLERKNKSIENIDYKSAIFNLIEFTIPRLQAISTTLQDQINTNTNKLNYAKEFKNKYDDLSGLFGNGGTTIFSEDTVFSPLKISYSEEDDYSFSSLKYVLHNIDSSYLIGKHWIITNPGVNNFLQDQSIESINNFILGNYSTLKNMNELPLKIEISTQSLYKAFSDAQTSGNYKLFSSGKLYGISFAIVLNDSRNIDEIKSILENYGFIITGLDGNKILVTLENFYLNKEESLEFLYDLISDYHRILSKEENVQSTIYAKLIEERKDCVDKILLLDSSNRSQKGNFDKLQSVANNLAKNNDSLNILNQSLLSELAAIQGSLELTKEIILITMRGNLKNIPFEIWHDIVKEVGEFYAENVLSPQIDRMREYGKLIGALWEAHKLEKERKIKKEKEDQDKRNIDNKEHKDKTIRENSYFDNAPVCEPKIRENSSSNR